MRRRNFLAAVPVISALIAAGSWATFGDSVQPVDDGLDDFIPGYVKDTYSPVELEAYKKELSAALKSNYPLTTWTCKPEETDECVYGSYPRGWSKPIGVSYHDWELGTLVEINGITYTVIEILGPKFGDQSVLLDRPLEKFIEAYSGRQTSCIKIVGKYQPTTLWH